MQSAWKAESRRAALSAAAAILLKNLATSSFGKSCCMLGDGIKSFKYSSSSDLRLRLHIIYSLLSPPAEDRWNMISSWGNRVSERCWGGGRILLRAPPSSAAAWSTSLFGRWLWRLYIWWGKRGKDSSGGEGEGGLRDAAADGEEEKHEGEKRDAAAEGEDRRRQAATDCDVEEERRSPWFLDFVIVWSNLVFSLLCINICSI